MSGCGCGGSCGCGGGKGSLAQPLDFAEGKPARPDVSALISRIDALEEAITSYAAMEFGDLPGHPFHGNQWITEFGKFTEQNRESLAKKGKALPDGSFPIRNASDFHNAVKAVGRSKNPAAAKAFIIKRAGQLNLTDELPDSWQKKD